MKPEIVVAQTCRLFIKLFLAVCLAGVAAHAQQSLTWGPSGSGGTGTWNLNSTADWYNGTADVTWTDNSAAGTNTAIFGGTAGTVTLGSSLSASNLTFNTTGYTLAGSGTLTLGGGINAASLSSGTVTLNNALALPASQQLWQVGSGATLALDGALTRSLGGSVDFSASGVTTTSSALANDTTGVIGGWATVGDTTSSQGNWAANNGSGGITTYTGYTAVSAGASSSPSMTGTSTQNWITGAFGGNNNVTTITTSGTVNSIVQQGDISVNGGTTLTIGNGGYIMSGISRWMLGTTTSFLTSGASTGELFVHVPENDANANNWTIWPVIEDNGLTPVTLVKDDNGLLKLGNMNTYSGGTIINAGSIATTGQGLYGNGSPATGPVSYLGTGLLTLNPGTELQLGNEVGGNNFSEFDLSNPVTVNGGTVYENDAFQHLKGPLAIGPGGATLGSTYNGDTDPLLNGFGKGLFVDGLLTGTGNMTLQQSGIATGAAYESSTVYFTSEGTAVQNTYSGTITVIPYSAEGGSYLFLIGTNVLANATINLTGDNSASGGRLGAPSFIFGSGTNLDGAGYATIGALSGSGDFVLADTLVTNGTPETATHSIGRGFTLTVGNNNASTTYSGDMSGGGSLVKIGAGTLTLSGTNTYTGNTVVGGGKLILTGAFVASTNTIVNSGATLDVSALSSVTIASGQNLLSSGTNNGSFGAAAGSEIYGDAGATYGTNTFNDNLTLAPGALVHLSVGTANTGPNDLISVGGTVTANNNIVHVSAPGTSASLQTANYVLFTSANTISGSFASAPAWDVAPVNAAHFSVVTSGKTVTLQYAANTSPSGNGSATPGTALRNQNVFISVTANNGTGGTVDSVTVDTSPIGGSTTFALVSAGGNVWTNTIAVAPGTLAGNYTLAATITDTASLSGIANIPLTVEVANDVWNGAGTDNNFSTGLNWTNQLAPGYIGDSLEFAGTARLSPNMNNGYTISSLLFDSGAGAFDISSGNGSILTLSGPNVVNNSANTQTLSVPVALGPVATFNTAAGNIAVSGAISGPANVTKMGGYELTLSGNNTYTGQTTVSSGTLNLSGSIASTVNFILGGAVGNSVLDISGTLSPYYLLVGNTAGSVAAIYQSGGVLTATNDSGYDNLSLGNMAGSFGYYDAIGGSSTVNGIAVAGEDNNGGTSNFGGNAGNGVMDINGATVDCTGWFVMCRNANAQTGILNVYNGSLSFAGGGLVCSWGSGQTSVINVMGGEISSAAEGIGLGGGSYNGILNLDGGLVSVSVVGGNFGGTAGQLNFNGGTLQANASASSLVQVTSANVYSGGALIDNNGGIVGVAQPLVAPAGDGIYGATVTSGGAGYIAPPIVTVVPGSGDTTGAGATAIAQINPLTGTVTNVVITCPGVNYTATPTFTLAGGGASAQAVITGEPPVPNVCGGLLCISAGGLQLTGASTYTGATVISNAGALYLAPGGSIYDSTNIIPQTGATFDVSQLSSYTLAAGQMLSGNGTVNGPTSGTLSAAPSSIISAGYAGIYGTNTINSSLTLSNGAVCSLALGTAYDGANDQIVVDGAIIANDNSIHLQAPSSSVNLDTTADYVLITAQGGIEGAFNTAPIWDVRPLNAGHYSIVTSANEVTLHYNPANSAPSVTATANPATVQAYQTTVITADVFPGSGNVTNVSVNLTPLGGSVVTLVQSNSSNIYTNSVTIPPGAPPGPLTLTVTVTDTTPLSGSGNAALTISTTGEVWDGSGSNSNWSTGANWMSGYPPAYAGDSLTFAGATGLTPNVDTNYSVPSVTFSNNAGSFNISSANSSTLTMTGSGSIINNSANPQTLNVTIADTGEGLNTGGNGVINLTGADTYTGPTVVRAGALNIAGTIASTANVIVGSSASNAVLDISGSSSFSPYYLIAGNASNSVGAVYQTGGTFNLSSASGFDNLDLGNVPGSYGYYDAIGGTVTASGVAVAGEGNNGISSSFDISGSGIMDINGGTVNDTGWFVMARNNNSTNGNEIATLNVYSGSLTYSGGGLVGPWDTGESAVINVMGGSVANTTAVGVYLGNTGYEGILNLNGGSLQASVVQGYNGPSYAPVIAGQVNFNGGTLAASAANGDFIEVTAADIYSGGATINNNGYAVGISQPLLAPTGNGVSGIAHFTGGAGYIAPPTVVVVRGAGDTTGTGATAIAQINPLTGMVTNVLITCPGVNYTEPPTFTVFGGGATMAATITGESPTQNSSGGLTAIGSGVTTLSGANTYTGNTTVSNGTLEIANAVLYPYSTVSVAIGATLQLGFATTNTVASLVLNGVSQFVGVYNNANTPTYITGTGSLLVTGVSNPPPASLSYLKFTAIPKISGTTLTISATNNGAGTIYLLTSTNAAAPLNTWVPVWTNVLAGSGSFTNQINAVNVAQHQQYYLLSNTNN